MSTLPGRLDEILAERVHLRTGRRIPDLQIEVRDSEVILFGTAQSFHVKQLALLGAQEAAPAIPVRNSIAVVRSFRPRQAVHTHM